MWHKAQRANKLSFWRQKRLTHTYTLTHTSLSCVLVCECICVSICTRFEPKRYDRSYRNADKPINRILASSRGATGKRSTHTHTHTLHLAPKTNYWTQRVCMFTGRLRSAYTNRCLTLCVRLTLANICRSRSLPVAQQASGARHN